MTHLLDTNACIHLITGRRPEVLARLQTHEPGDVVLSSITVAELRYGADRSGRPEQNHRALDLFVQPFAVRAFDGRAARLYGRVRAGLERAGTPIGPLDTLIAAHALALGVALVTNNVRELVRVAGLDVEDWTGLSPAP